MNTLGSRLAGEPKDYEKLGISKGTVAPWEDGSRTDGGSGSYEWWYFDAHLDDGTKLVIVFYTKRMMKTNSPLSPYVTIDLDTPDGRHFEERLEVKGIPWSSSEEGCDVKCGPCYIKGDLKEYSIYYDDGNIQAEATLRANVPSWRPGTGHIYFGDDDEHFFAWLPSVPEGDVQAEITVDGITTTHTGTGYHDHNWGNIVMTKVMHHWYWGRAKVGGYNVISSYIYAEKKYGYNEFPIFMLAKDGEIVADDGQKLTFIPADVFSDEVTGKPAHNQLVYQYEDEGRAYRVTWARRTSLIAFRMIDQLKGVIRLLARISGFDAAYLRFTGDVTVEEVRSGAEPLTQEGPAIWEEMYFGKTRQ
ncbi:MAG: hypothetical protein LBN35_03150 [Clostridiales Family XIII bacterium]|jgi:hypothetical protein|nr:hypothetical protein [Clostridiales Family XIII bacterium]